MAISALARADTSARALAALQEVDYLPGRLQQLTIDGYRLRRLDTACADDRSLLPPGESEDEQLSACDERSRAIGFEQRIDSNLRTHAQPSLERARDLKSDCLPVLTGVG